MVLVGAISHTSGIDTNPALVQVISGQSIDEIKISNLITYESSVLLLLIKSFYAAIHIMPARQISVNEKKCLIYLYS